MKIPLQTFKCILCLSTDSITQEHVIPKSLGGKLISDFLCKACNSKLGHGPESKVRDDPICRESIERLALARPDIADDIRNGFRYIRRNEQGEVTKHVLRDGTLKVIPQRQDDGSLILPEDKVLKTVDTMAKRHRHGPLFPVAFDLGSVSPGDSVEAARGIEIRKLPSGPIEPDLTGDEMDLVVPAIIAFEFLALHCGDTIYENRPQFKSVRDQLLAGKLSEEDVHVERREAMNQRLFHGLLFEGNNPGARVQVWLFGRLAFFVDFRHIAVLGPRYWYEYDLVSEKEKFHPCDGD